MGNDTRARLRELAEGCTNSPWFADNRSRGIVDRNGYYFAQVDDDGNRAWIEAANPSTVLTLLDRLDAVDKLLAAAG